MRALGIIVVVLAQQVMCDAAPLSVEVNASADVFVWSEAPSSNYGGAGGLAVSGLAAENALGEQMGLMDTFLRFSVSDLVQQADMHFGRSDWIVTGVSLALIEQSAPNNPIFNRGIGDFEVRWICSDAWLEGTGNPRKQTTDGVTYDDEPLLLDAADHTLGIFSNTGNEGVVTFELDLPDAFTEDIRSGTDVSLFMTAASDSIGFTFDSRKNTPPMLTILIDLPVTGDVDGDHCVNVLDLLAVRANLGRTGSEISPPRADIDGDGTVNVMDLLSVRSQLGSGSGCAR